MKNIIMTAMIVATGLFVFGLAPALANSKPEVFWCVSISEKKHYEKTCNVYIWNPTVIKGNCICEEGYTLYNPNTDIVVPSPPKSSGS